MLEEKLSSPLAVSSALKYKETLTMEIVLDKFSLHYKCFGSANVTCEVVSLTNEQKL
jgi:hypothetical protein